MTASTGQPPMRDYAPWAPPIVTMSDTTVGHLLAWELIEVDGSWWAWVSWVHQHGARPFTMSSQSAPRQ